MLFYSCCILIFKLNKHLYLYWNKNHLPNGFFLITTSQQRVNRALPIFLKFMRSLNDKRVNKLSSRMSSGISNIPFSIEIDITTVKLYDFKALTRLMNLLKRSNFKFILGVLFAFLLILELNLNNLQRRKI